MIIVKYWNGSAFKKLNPFYKDIQFTEIIDQYGGFSFTYPATDPLAGNVQDRKQIQILDDDTLLFTGTVTQKETSFNDDVPVITFSGVGLLEEFANELTLSNILYQNELYTDILDPTYPNTLIRPNTWQTIVEPTTEDLTYLSSMQSSLRTFQVVQRQAGFHFRYAGTILQPRTIEFSTFGNSSGYRIRSNPNNRYNLADNILVLEQGGLTKIGESLSIVNWVYPIGGGGDNGVNQLTLRDVDPLIIDPLFPIYIDSGTPNTDAVYDPNIFDNIKTGPNTYQAFYMKEPVSIATYGAIKKPISFNDIYPVSDSGSNITDLNRTNAANELYRATRQYLLENSSIKESFNASCIGKTNTLKVGDKVNLKFKGEIKKLNQNSTTSTVWADINQDFYVSALRTEILDNDLRRYALTLTIVLKYPENDIGVIASAIDSINDSSRQRRGSVTTYPVYFEDSYDDLHPAEFLFWIPPETVYTDYLRLKVRIKPFRSYSQAVGGGGGVTQSTTTEPSSTPTTSAGGATAPTTSSSASHSHTVSISDHTHTVNVPISNAGPTTSLLYANYLMSPTLVAPLLPGNTNVFGASANAGGAIVTSSTSNGLHAHSVTIGDHVHNVTVSAHNHSITLVNHTHTIQFGIYEDSLTIPADTIITIDGVDYSSELGMYNAFGDYPAGGTDNFDLMDAAFNLGVLSSLLTPGTHTISVSCSSGRGKVQLSIYNQFYLSSK